MDTKFGHIDPYTDVDTQTDTGCGATPILADAIRVPKVPLETKAIGDKQYFWGLDLAHDKDYSVVAECHEDENGHIVIDRIIQPKPELGCANQGL